MKPSVAFLSAAIAAVVYHNEPRPLPLNAGMVPTNRFAIIPPRSHRAIEYQFPVEHARFPQLLFVFGAEPLANDHNGYVYGTNYSIGFMDGPKRVVVLKVKTLNDGEIDPEAFK